jgi:DNA-binding GntR family transcriptional regulator
MSTIIRVATSDVSKKGMKSTRRSEMPMRRSPPSRTHRESEVAAPPNLDVVAGARETAPEKRQQFSRTAWLIDVLRQRIVTGEYQPGERIPEARLRAEFGFSNGPIREALQWIVADGLAERAPWQGVRIKALTEKQILELFQVRTALLEYAAELAARTRSPATIASAQQLKQGMDRGFADMAHAVHPSFHGQLSQWLLTAAGNEALRSIWEKTMLQTLVYVNASLKKSRGAKSRVLIHQLIGRICEGDVALARAAARQMTQQTLTELGIAGTV